MPWRKPHAWLLAALLIYSLYFFHLTAAGMLGPDEPRYAAIGREMARSGDWITPRLWGEPWFEKPALLYWMTGAAYRLGLSGELAPRLPVALLSVTFLVFFWWMLRREFGARTAWFAALILGTSAGWIGMSQVGVTDIPLAATFSAAVLLSLRWVQKRDATELPYAAGCLGLAALAKGFVGPALFLPVLWFARRRLADLRSPRVWGPFLAVAVPWYVACFVKNGWSFLNDFFWRQHAQRVFSDSLAHGQPFWFYLPVFLAALFPWTPLALCIWRQRVRRAGSVLLWIVIFGLALFSIPLNKLPEYLLPLLPAAAALAGIALADLPERTARWLLAACAGLAGLAPLCAAILPEALARGFTKSHFSSATWLWILPLMLGVAAGIFRPAVASSLVAVAVAAGVVYLKIVAMPAIDEAASARPLWREIAGKADQVCIQQIHRSWRYGLNYYSVTPLPFCWDADRPLHIFQEGANHPQILQSEGRGKQ